MNMREQQIHDLSWMHAALLKLRFKHGPRCGRARFNQCKPRRSFNEKYIGGTSKI
jgi:hypothetical protein